MEWGGNFLTLQVPTPWSWLYGDRTPVCVKMPLLRNCAGVALTHWLWGFGCEIRPAALNTQSQLVVLLGEAVGLL